MRACASCAVLLLAWGCDGDGSGPRDGGRTDGGMDTGSAVVCCPRDNIIPCGPGWSLGGAAGPGGCEDNVHWGYDGTWQRTVDELGCPVWRDVCCGPSDPDAGIWCCGCDGST